MSSTPSRTAAQTIRFGSLDIGFDHQVLRPRPWTAAQSRWAADLLRFAPAGNVLDLCTGAGHIGLLAVADNDRRLVAVDLNPVAVGFAVDNARAAGLASRVEVRCGDLGEVVRGDERFALVIADPPWVRRGETDRFPEDPLLAIDGGDDGLGIARSCVEVVEHHLAPGGSGLLQLGTVEQLAQLSDWLAVRDTLRVTEMRVFEGQGVVARLERVQEVGNTGAGS